MVIDKEISLEWSRIPHFYYNYYVYQYATGYSASAEQPDLKRRQACGGALYRILKSGKLGISD